MQFHQLPLDCVRHVFDWFTLPDLIKMRAVSREWALMVEEMCAEKRVLRLFNTSSREWYGDKVSEFNLQQERAFQVTDLNSLSISCPTNFAAVADRKIPLIGKKLQPRQSSLDNPDVGYRFIARLFPSVSALVMSNNLERLEDLFYLLRQWSPNLTTLIILGAKGIQISKSTHRDLWCLIGSMHTLVELHLLELEYDNEVPSKTKILSQLEAFTYDQYTGTLLTTFRQLGPSLRSLRIGNHRELYNYAHLKTVNPRVCASVRQLACAFDWIGTSVSTICGQFSALECLDISSMRMTVSKRESIIELFQALTECTHHLVELKLSWFNVLNEFKGREGDRDFVRSLPVLEGIRVLRLTDHCDETQPEQIGILKVFFPQSEHIHVEVEERKLFDDIEPQLRGTFGAKVGIHMALQCHPQNTNATTANAAAIAKPLQPLLVDDDQLVERFCNLNHYYNAFVEDFY